MRPTIFNNVDILIQALTSVTMDALLPARHRGRCARGNEPRGAHPTVSFHRLARI
jgi:hypothetical protein